VSNFLKLSGTSNSGIIIDGGDLSKVTTPVVFSNGASVKAVRLRS
jgi:hypothetical protein